ncbi:sugar phosphate isomerase/epimerase family protein [Marinomonas sp. IMCC 4694]|uniref:sugar phosphate isomerase/epimerase family protein n=1 Tax=Marinomonas sp. IMCC 4694 TaxID=2605432 RepID=UPI0011E89342|nr:sugar phosphate isomerase/epimerase [Marinomonas sp. IMCC 4694]TYL46965.1 sugar phosphate isomerase/epimerase [Marinomonas sp. IMCC 4694]
MTPFSFQLYSARNTASLDEVFALLAASGYQQVEGYGGLYDNLDTLQTLMEKYGLTMPTGHFDLAMLEHNLPRALYIAKVLGMHTIICPYILEQDRPSDFSGWFAFGQRLEAVCQQVNTAGFEFGWHNHDFEFAAFEDGRLPMTALLEGAPSILWEMDVAWVAKGECNPVDWLTQYRERICAVHLKDIAPLGECLNEDGWADFTQGILPWAEYWVAVRQTPARTFVMEHDNPSDVSRFARRSIDGATLIVGATA